MKRFLTILMVACVLSVFPGALNCQCVDADCGSVFSSSHPKAPQCHPAAVSTRGEEPSPKECCSQCQIEKAAVLTSTFSAVSDARPRNTIEEIKSFEGFFQGTHPHFFYREFAGSPPEYFTQSVLNTTFSFRAPPRG